jgi:hypothetical protein
MNTGLKSAIYLFCSVDYFPGLFKLNEYYMGLNINSLEF